MAFSDLTNPSSQWYRKAAEKGHATAMYHLGVRYYNGQGVARSTYRAKEWMRKARDAGCSDAQAARNKMS